MLQLPVITLSVHAALSCSALYNMCGERYVNCVILSVSPDETLEVVHLFRETQKRSCLLKVINDKGVFYHDSVKKSGNPLTYLLTFLLTYSIQQTPS